MRRWAQDSSRGEHHGIRDGPPDRAALVGGHPAARSRPGSPTTVARPPAGPDTCRGLPWLWCRGRRPAVVPCVAGQAQDVSDSPATANTTPAGPGTNRRGTLPGYDLPDRRQRGRPGQTRERCGSGGHGRRQRWERLGWPCWASRRCPEPETPPSSAQGSGWSPRPGPTWRPPGPEPLGRSPRQSPALPVRRRPRRRARPDDPGGGPRLMSARRLLARSLLALVLACLAGLAVWDRVRVEQVLGEFQAQREADCLVFAPAALRPILPETRPNEICVIIAAAASVDRAGCREGPIRPDLDTSPDALDACLARAVGAVPPGGGG